MTTWVHGTQERYRAKVSFERAGRYVDLSSDPVEMAFVAVGDVLSDGDFADAEWEVNDQIDPPDYIAVGDITSLAEGDWDIYVRVTDDPEIPIKLVDDVLTLTPGLP